MSYFIARNQDVRASDIALAPRYSNLDEAVRDMGDGVVFDEAGEIRAFHERHLGILQHRRTLRMTNK
jgi:hypothetical protein